VGPVLGCRADDDSQLAGALTVVVSASHEAGACSRGHPGLVVIPGGESMSTMQTHNGSGNYGYPVMWWL